MEFHPAKCQLLRITNKLKPIKSNYTIHDTPLLETPPSKYLWVVIDSKLQWKEHYASISKSCNGTLAFLKRNLSKAPEHIKNKCYTTLVRPKLEYACAVWDPHCKNHTNSLEQIQKRAARFVTNNYKMESGNTKINLDKLNWPSLEERRLQTKLTIFQKARLNLIDIPTDHLVLNTRQTRQGGDGPTYFKEFSKIDSYIYSFYPRTALLWNHLPTDIRTSNDIGFFKKQISNINLTCIKENRMTVGI